MEAKRISLDRTTVQIIAALTMLCDHIACLFVDAKVNPMLYDSMRIIGRISFPLFCFLLVQGFLTTGNLRKYIMRIFVFALLSEIPFNLAFFGTAFYPGAQNVLFTMLIGLLVLCGMKKYEADSYLIKVAIFLAGCFSAYVLKTDYTYLGVALIMVFYITYQNSLAMLFWTVLLFVANGGMQAYAVLALPFCTMCRADKKGKRFPRYFFYVFYPLHLFLLWSCRYLSDIRI